MVTDDDVLKVQRLYPQIYLGCHKQHVRATSTSFRISSQDASILVHLDNEVPIAPQTLAAHLGIKPPTLSAAIARLARLGYLEITTDQRDRRKRELRLTKRGLEAIKAASVLDADRVLEMLRCLTSKEKREALHGLELLAKAARCK